MMGWLGFLWTPYMFVCLNWILLLWLWVDCIFDRLGYGCQSRYCQFLRLYHGNTGNTWNFIKDLWVQFRCFKQLENTEPELFGRTQLVDILASLISIIEQQPQHDRVPQAVLQGSGEQRVVYHLEVTIHLCPIGQQQLHKITPGKRTERGILGYASATLLIQPTNAWGYCCTPLSPHGDQDARQRVKVSPRPSCQQHLSAGCVPIGNSKVQRGLPQVSVVLCNMIYVRVGDDRLFDSHPSRSAIHLCLKDSWWLYFIRLVK